MFSFFFQPPPPLCAKLPPPHPDAVAESRQGPRQRLPAHTPQNLQPELQWNPTNCAKERSLSALPQKEDLAWLPYHIPGLQQAPLPVAAAHSQTTS